MLLHLTGTILNPLPHSPPPCEYMYCHGKVKFIDTLFHWVIHLLVQLRCCILTRVFAKGINFPFVICFWCAVPHILDFYGHSIINDKGLLLVLFECLLLCPFIEVFGKLSTIPPFPQAAFLLYPCP